MVRFITLGTKGAKEGIMANNEISLARGAIGLREVLFQSVTSMAPAGAVALSIAAGATYAGGALPLMKRVFADEPAPEASQPVGSA
jgi:hypothetical protein